jgi:hypothetical protein
VNIPADEHASERAEGMNPAQTNPRDAQPLMEMHLTVAEVAEKLGISLEAACAVIAAGLGSNQTGSWQRNPL